MYPFSKSWPNILAGGLAVVLAFMTLAIAPLALARPAHHPAAAAALAQEDGQAGKKTGRRVDRIACVPPHGPAHHARPKRTSCNKDTPRRLARRDTPR